MSFQKKDDVSKTRWFVANEQKKKGAENTDAGKNKLNIVHLGMGVIPIPPGDVAASGEEYIYLLTNHLGQMNCRVHVIDIKGGAYQKKIRQQSSAKFHEVWHLPLPSQSKSPFLQHFFNYLLVMSQTLLFSLLSSFTLNRLLSKEKIDIIHTHNREPAIATIVTNKLWRRGALTVYAPKAAYGFAKLSRRKKIINFAEFLALKWVDHIVAMTPAVKTWLVSEFKLDPAKISQIYAGADSHEIDQFLSHKAGAPHLANIILCTGTVSGRKNQFSAVKAIPHVIKKHPEVKFVFTGPVSDAQYLASIQRFIAENSLSQWVEFKGIVPKQELYNLYSDAILFFFPTTAEIDPVSLKEALVFGLPIVSSTIEPIADVVNEGEGSAILVDPYDVTGMAEAINRILDDSSLRQSMSEHARELGKCFSYEGIAKQTLDLYQELIKNKKIPQGATINVVQTKESI